MGPLFNYGRFYEQPRPDLGLLGTEKPMLTVRVKPRKITHFFIIVYQSINGKVPPLLFPTAVGGDGHKTKKCCTAYKMPKNGLLCPIKVSL